ncbi:MULTISPECIES: shikimate kinase [unclassified Rathayibacter]|uniref:shikimate kinase n=1 Tax=unclassified Rathayibacter TaxID=2609250 RepID=UPI001889E0F1|nr:MULTISPECIES: shikimate kinase [unclassified Rathayibacter]MBF4462448.1 shikimate kinase [Rathayibacter sp. VKM Ac-2879]MBF4503509.1 shikimate kinase [Rathayibacter sp. VKM Ac-2878]
MAGHDTDATRPRVVFIGPMGSGKTTIGKRVAKALAGGFADSDVEFVRQHGPIALYFQVHGEAAFRREERRVVERLLRRDIVLSLGGGAVLDERTRAELASAPVVLLTTTAEAVAGRLGGGARPLVTGGVSDWVRILEERRPVYEALADTVVDTSRRPITLIASEIAEWVRAREAGAPRPPAPSHPAAASGRPSGRQS